MVAAVPREAYRAQLHGLLPTGRAWPDEIDTTIDLLVDALAAQMAEIDRGGANLLTEIRPSTTFSLLTDWERVAGLPDSCSALGSTPTIRRASLLAKLVAQPTLRPSQYIAIAARYGVTITVDELDQARADALPNLDTTTGKWRFVWWINIPLSADTRRFTTLSRVNERLTTFSRNTELECRLRKAAPAHTQVQIGYS